MFLTPTLGIGGAEKLTVSYALGMHRRGHDVGVSFGLIDSLAGRLRDEGIGAFNLSPRRLKPHTLPEWAWQFRKVVRTFRPDVIHAQSVTAALVARVVSPRVPMLVTIHGIQPSDERLASLLFRAANVKLTAVSEASAEGLSRHRWAPSVELLSPGIDVEGLRSEGRDDPPDLIGAPSLCCVARQEAVKGADVLLRAFVSVSRELPNAGLTLVGRGSQLEANRELAAALGLAERVHFTGAIVNAAPYLAAADIVVLPSRREGLPVVALEALALERPLVATKVGGTPTVVVDGVTGWLAAPEDEAALAAAILACARSPEEASRRAHAGRLLVDERFSADTMLDRIEAMLADLAPRAVLSRRPPRGMSVHAAPKVRVNALPASPCFR